MSANSQRRSGQVRAHGRLALRCFVRHVRARRRRAACRGRWWSGGESAVCVVCVLQPRFKHLHTASKFPKTRENKFAPASRRTHVQTTQNQAIVSLPPRRPSYCTPVALGCRPRQCKYLWFRLSSRPRQIRAIFRPLITSAILESKESHILTQIPTRRSLIQAGGSSIFRAPEMVASYRSSNADQVLLCAVRTRHTVTRWTLSVLHKPIACVTGRSSSYLSVETTPST
ncbi:hypothetical protein C8Q70DRAFT_507447 [Cubamyces menziesii]|nr:hypothetical protein C8Q70DRAFT_507447 [Cubamyces menziesii]